MRIIDTTPTAAVVITSSRNEDPYGEYFKDKDKKAIQKVDAFLEVKNNLERD